VFLLVLAYPDSPRSTAVKLLCVCTLFVRCLCSGFSASDKSAIWVLRCKQVNIMTEPCPAVKYAGQMDSSSLTNYFRVLNLPAIVSILRLH